jgi:hypothetical protein
MHTPTTPTTEWQFQCTDTFGGQPNFSWVQRGTATGLRDRALQNIFYRLGLRGEPVEIVDSGDVIECWFHALNCVLFVEPAEQE